jgi:hypothetical protein
VARSRAHRHIGGLEGKTSGAPEVAKARDWIRTVRLWGRVAEIQAIGESPDEEAVHRSLVHRDIGDPGDKLSVHFGIAKRETPMSGGQLSAHQEKEDCSATDEG